MKKNIFIPVLAAGLLLTGCSGVSEPSFNRMGDEISYSSFVKAVQEAFEKSEINKEDKPIIKSIEKKK